MAQPRVREFAPAMVYLLSLTLAGGTAYQYVSAGSRAPRARAASNVPTPSPSVSPVSASGRMLLSRDHVLAGTTDTVQVHVFDAVGRPLTPDELRGGSVRFAVVPENLTEITPLSAQPDGPGCWQVFVSLPAGGAYRLITQVRSDAAAEPLVLGADLNVLHPS